MRREGRTPSRLPNRAGFPLTRGIKGNTSVSPSVSRMQRENIPELQMFVITFGKLFHPLYTFKDGR